MKVKKNRVKLDLSQMDVLVEDSSPYSIGFGRGAFFSHDASLIGVRINSQLGHAIK